MVETEEKVMEYLQKGYSCGQIMMLLSMDLRGIEDVFTIRAMGALGGGMCAQRACGTVTGAVCAISSYFPRVAVEPTGYKEPAKKLVAWFEEEHGSLECHELLEHQTETKMEFCPRLMASTFEKMLEVLENHGIDPYE